MLSLGHGHDCHEDANAADDSADNVRQEAQVNDGDSPEEGTLSRLERRSVVVSSLPIGSTSAVHRGDGENNHAEGDNETDPEEGNKSVEDVSAHQAVSLTRATSNDSEDTEKELEEVDQETEGANTVPGRANVHVIVRSELCFSVSSASDTVSSSIGSIIGSIKQIRHTVQTPVTQINININFSFNRANIGCIVDAIRRPSFCNFHGV